MPKAAITGQRPFPLLYRASQTPSRSIGVLIAAVALTGACGDADPADPGNISDAEALIRHVVVVPEQTVVRYLNGPIEMTAFALDQASRPLPGVGFTWSSSEPAVVAVRPNGGATSVSNGMAEISATAFGITGTSTIVVDQTVHVVQFAAPPPCGIPAHAVLEPAVIVRLLDSAGSAVTHVSDPVLLSVQSEDGLAAVSGTYAARAANGAAVFDDLSIDRPGKSYRLIAAVNGVSGESDSFDIQPGPRSLCVEDPAGDHTGRIDVTRMVVNFDDQTGAYAIEITAHPNNPFAGDFRVNLNLFNVNVANSFPEWAMFRDVGNDFAAVAAADRLTLSGVSTALRQWSAGDLVYTNSLAGTPNPVGTSLFRSSVSDLPGPSFLNHEDFIAFAAIFQPAIVR